MDTNGVKLVSFGYRYGLPPEADMVLDVRGLQNPFYIPELKALTGRDQPVQDYIFSFPESREYLLALIKTIELRLALWQRGSYQPLCIAFGCTGGQHRSVAMLLKAEQKLRSEGWQVCVEHRDIDKERG